MNKICTYRGRCSRSILRLELRGTSYSMVLLLLLDSDHLVARTMSSFLKTTCHWIGYWTAPNPQRKPQPPDAPMAPFRRLSLSEQQCGVFIPHNDYLSSLWTPWNYNFFDSSPTAVWSISQVKAAPVSLNTAWTSPLLDISPDCSLTRGCSIQSSSPTTKIRKKIGSSPLCSSGLRWLVATGACPPFSQWRWTPGATELSVEIWGQRIQGNRCWTTCRNYEKPMMPLSSF